MRTETTKRRSSDNYREVVGSRHRNAVAAAVAAVLTSSFAPTSQAFGQAPANDATADETPIDEIVVTGRYRTEHTDLLTRAPADLRDIPNSISVLSAAVLGDQNIHRIDEALDNLAGLHRRSNNRQVFFDRFIIRGVDSNIGFSGALLENGLPGGTNYPADFALIDRVEVIKGPASIVAGGSPPGGLINRVLKSPEEGNFAEVSVSGTSYGKFRGSLDVNHAFGDTLSRFVVAASDGNEYIDGVSERHVSAAPSLYWNVSDKTTLRVTGNVYVGSGEPFYGLPIFGDGSVPDVEADFNFDYTGADAASEHYAADAELVHDLLDDLTLTVKVGASDTHHDTVSVYAYNYPPGLQANGDTNIYAGFRSQDIRRVAADVFATKSLNLGYEDASLTAGVTFLSVEEEYIGGYDYVGGGVTNIFNPQNTFAVPENFSRMNLFDQALDYQQAAAYAQLIVHPAERLTLMASGRFDFVIDGTTRNFSNENSVDEDAFTGRFGLSYALNNTTSIYASYSESFLPQPNAITQTGALLDSEEGLQYELGVKSEVLDERLLITAAVFNIVRENVAASDPTNANFSIGLGEIESEGFELELVGQIAPGLDAIASYTYLEGSITEGDADQIGLELEVPRNKASLWAQYEVQEGPLSGLRTGIGIFYQDEQPDELLGQTFVVDGYTRLDATVAYTAIPRVELKLNIENITDERYLQGPGNLNYNIFGAGRNATFTVSYVFD